MHHQCMCMECFMHVFIAISLAHWRRRQRRQLCIRKRERLRARHIAEQHQTLGHLFGWMVRRSKGTTTANTMLFHYACCSEICWSLIVRNEERTKKSKISAIWIPKICDTTEKRTKNNKKRATEIDTKLSIERAIIFIQELQPNQMELVE